jgi:integrase/recombinase XerD
MAHLPLPPRTDRQRLPRVLSVEELHRLCTATKHPKHRALLMTTYAAGLRVSEVVRLQVTDSESERRGIRVNQGKGNKDRYTLLSTRLLTELRTSWQLLRPPRWLFPGRSLSEPMPSGTARKIDERARQRAQLPRGASRHSLRHSLATHLLDARVDPRTLQVLLRPRALATTARYLHVSRRHLGPVRSPLDLLSFPADVPPRAAE